MQKNSTMMICFNPRTRKGCDSLSQSENGIISVVSIHAPVKDATRNEFYNPHICDVSIHAPVKDATIVSKMFLFLWQFQSTHP